MANKRVIKADSQDLISWNLPPHLTGVVVKTLGEPKHNFIKVLPEWNVETCHIPEVGLTDYPDWTEIEHRPAAGGYVQIYSGKYRGVQMVKHRKVGVPHQPAVHYDIFYLGTSATATHSLHAEWRAFNAINAYLKEKNGGRDWT